MDGRLSAPGARASIVEVIDVRSSRAEDCRGRRGDRAALAPERAGPSCRARHALPVRHHPTGCRDRATPCSSASRTRGAATPTTASASPPTPRSPAPGRAACPASATSSVRTPQHALRLRRQQLDRLAGQPRPLLPGDVRRRDQQLALRRGARRDCAPGRQHHDHAHLRQRRDVHGRPRHLLPDLRVRVAERAHQQPGRGLPRAGHRHGGRHLRGQQLAGQQHHPDRHLLIDSICTFRVPATDPNGDTLKWRLATSTEASGSSTAFHQPGPPNATNAATINANTGLYTWDTQVRRWGRRDSTPSTPRR